MSALFLSDLHLGSKHCQADRLLKFLRQQVRDTLYLVGDAIDDLGMKHWPRAHVAVLELLLAFRKVIYLPGNHDSMFRAIAGLSGQVTIFDRGFYETGGRKYLVEHGDAYDPSLWMCVGPKWLRAKLAGGTNLIHTKLLAGYLERKIAADARAIGCDGVICGHTHRPAQKIVGGVEYLNCGDWINHCTALIDSGNSIELVAA